MTVQRFYAISKALYQAKYMMMMMINILTKSE